MAQLREYKDVQEWTVQKVLTSLLKGNSRGTHGAWKDEASDGLLEIHATAALLWSATEGIHTLQAPWPGHEDPGESDETPQASGDTKAKWRARMSTSVYTGIAGMNRYNIIIIKQEIRYKTEYE